MKSTVALSALLFLLLLGSCGGEDTPTAPTPTPTPVATSITLSATSLSFSSLGETSQLTATVQDQNGATMSGASVTWATSAASVATVSSSGLVTSVADGSATITATSGSASGTAEITVNQVSVPTMTHEQSIKLSTGSIWSIPVYDGSNLVLSTEVIGASGGIYLSKYDPALTLVGTATHIVSPDVLNNTTALTYTYANNITSIADHKHIFQDGYHYITFSSSGRGNGGNLYLMKIDTALVLQNIVEVTTDNAPTNDMFLVGDGSKIHVGKFHPGQGHDIYTFDANLNSEGSAIPIGNTGSGNETNQHANGAAAIFHNNQFHLVAPETLAPGQGDYFYRIVFDKDWDIVEERTIILTDMTMLGIVSGLSHEPNTDTFIVHYTRGDTDGGGYIYQAIYDGNWAMLENEVLISTGNYQRPHSLLLGNDLFLGYDSAGVYLSKFKVTYP